MPKKKKGSKNIQIQEKEEWPKISILTPLYNRNKWIPLMLCNLDNFDYPKHQIEWCILDSKDGDEDVRLLENQKIIDLLQKRLGRIKLNYQYIDHKMTIAEKRTYLAKNMMSHKWFANLDSDDIYFPGYLKYSIQNIKTAKKGLSSSNQMLFLFPHYDYKICAIQCQAKRQCHEACMVGTKQYLRSMNYFDKKAEKGEGASVIDGNENQVLNLDIQHLMICVCHNNNTCSKEMFKETNVQDAKLAGTHVDVVRGVMAHEVEMGFKDNAPHKGSPELAEDISTTNQTDVASPT